MPRVRSLLSITLASIAVTAWVTPTAAQELRHGSVEFALLESINFAGSGDESATILTFPTVSPAIRMTFWTQSPLTVDFGLSFVSISGEDNDAVTILWLEGGAGADLGKPNSSWRPFVGGLFGLISVSAYDTESEPYIGAQVGLRHFVKDFAATRLQVGYRKTLGDKIDLGNLEIAGGVSFFL